MIVDTARWTATRLGATNTDGAALTFIETAALGGVCRRSGDEHRSEDGKNNNGESHLVDMSNVFVVVSIEFEYKWSI